MNQQQIQASVQRTLTNTNITSTASVKTLGSNGVIIQPKKPNAFKKKDPALYRFMDEQHRTLVKLPGQIAGEQFVLQNCHGCTIYLLDFSNTVYIDDCIDCQIYVGPVESSVFIRDCYRCKCVIACGQFRTRKCEDLSVLLMCQSQPIIESSLRMGFGCFRAAYPELSAQFGHAKIDPWNNTWSDIFDFTPKYRPNENHYHLLSDDLVFDDMLPPIAKVHHIEEQYEQQSSNQVVPFTYEIRQKVFCSQLLLMFFPQFTKVNDLTKLIPHFQPLPVRTMYQSQQNQQQMILVEDELQDPDEVIIDAPETLPYFLIKAKHSFLFPENWEIFRDMIKDAAPQQHSQLLKQMVVDDHLQRLFSVHVRTDDEDVDLMSYMRSLIALHYHDLPLNQACVTIKDGHYIDLLGGLVFANMADEKGDKMPQMQK